MFAVLSRKSKHSAIRLTQDAARLSRGNKNKTKKLQRDGVIAVFPTRPARFSLELIIFLMILRMAVK